MKYQMGMDIGGTSARLKLAREGEEPRAHSQFLQDRQHRLLIAQSGPLVSAGAQRTALCDIRPEDCAGLCIAASGIDSPEQEEECRRIFTEMGFCEKVVTVYNDCEIFLQFSREPSLVLVAGTGSIAVGKSACGRIVRSGGWGHILSDEGSAMDMGKRVLRAVGDHMDGRKHCPVLYRMFEQQSGITTLAELDIYVTDSIMDKPRIAGFAPLAEKAAREGEKAAQEILEECACALFGLVRDTFRKVSDGAQAPQNLYLWGSVLTRNREIEMRIKEKCRQAFPELKADFPGISALDLALSLAAEGA